MKKYYGKVKDENMNLIIEDRTVDKHVEINPEPSEKIQIIYIVLLFLAFFYSGGYVLKQLFRLNTNFMNCYGNNFLCRLEFYDYLFFPYFIIIGIFLYLLMKFYSKSQFIIINSCYTFFLLISALLFSTVLLMIAFGGAGNSPILKIFPINIFLYLLLSITSKYNMFNILFFCFWSVVFLSNNGNKYNTLKIKNKYDKASLILFNSVIFLTMLFAITLDKYSIIYFISTLLIVMATSWNYSIKTPMLKTNRIFILLFLLITFWPSIHFLITKSDILRNFIYK